MVGPTVRAALLVLATFATVATAESAADPQRVADMLVAATEATGEATLTYEAISAEGDAVTLTGVTMVASDEDGTVTIPALTVVGAVERDTGGFTATRIEFDSGIAVSAAATATWQTAMMENAVVPSPDEVTARTRIRPFSQLMLSGLAVTENDSAEPITVSAMSVQIGDLVDDAATRMLIAATGARLPASMITNPMGAAMIDGLGYTELTADITMDFDYDPSGDTVTIHALTIDALDAGRLAMAAQFSGLSFRGLTDPDESAEARAAARLNSMHVRFDDAGLVGRVLDMQATMLGGTRDEVRAQLVYGALPFALSFVENEAFRDQFMTAATAFLEDPQSFTVTFAPAEPVPLGQVVRTALRTPLALPDLLTAQVAAND